MLIKQGLEGARINAGVYVEVGTGTARQANIQIGRSIAQAQGSVHTLTDGRASLLDNHIVGTPGAGETAHAFAPFCDHHLATQWPGRGPIATDKRYQCGSNTLTLMIQRCFKNRDAIQNQLANSMGSTTTGLSTAK